MLDFPAKVSNPSRSWAKRTGNYWSRRGSGGGDDKSELMGAFRKHSFSQMSQTREKEKEGRETGNPGVVELGFVARGGQRALWESGGPG